MTGAFRLDDGGRARLRAAAADIVSYFRGEPNWKLSPGHRRELRWGRHGSFSLVIAGPKAGCWFDHEIGRGGDIISFIEWELDCAFHDALDFAAGFTGELRTAPKPQVTIDLKLPDDEARTAEALAIWHRSVSLRGTLAEDYLRSRGIEAPEPALEVLRFHPACPWGPYEGPCMVALVTDIVSDEPVAIHRTALNSDGTKRGRMGLGPVGGGAIKLSPQQAIKGELTIAEGVETALSANILGFGPVWSVIDAGGIARFPVLPALTIVQMFGQFAETEVDHLAGIRRLTIIADNDISCAGQRAARAATRFERARLFSGARSANPAQLRSYGLSYLAQSRDEPGLLRRRCAEAAIPSPMTDDISGYRFEDLQAARIVESRVDLARKQREHGFPIPVKLGKRQAWFPRSEVQDWLRERIAMRDREARKQAEQRGVAKAAVGA